MARRGRSSHGSGPPAKKARDKKTPAKTPMLNAPFRELGRRVRAQAPPPPAPRAAPAPPPPPDDQGLFANAMSGVVPLRRGPHGRIEGLGPGTVARGPVSEEAEALAALSDLVTGVARFDVTDTVEYVEGVVVGLDPRLVRRLRRGDFARQAHVDLHGLTAAEARDQVEAFLVAAVRDGLRCVLIVHGRGRNSKDQTPVLKERLKTWLAHGRLGRIVLAFATARPFDGGAGALYVLLRRDRRQRPIRVTEGAKR